MIRFAIAFFALAIWASSALAGPDDAFGKALMARIKSEGYRIESIKTTLLRRIQIDSSNRRNRRQTVYNPVSGVVLRDLIFPVDESGFLSHVTEIFGVDVRTGREGRGGQPEKGRGIGKDKQNAGRLKENNGKSGDKVSAGNDKPGGGKSGGGKSGGGGSGGGKSGGGKSK